MRPTSITVSASMARSVSGGQRQRYGAAILGHHMSCRSRPLPLLSVGRGDSVLCAEMMRCVSITQPAVVQYGGASQSPATSVSYFESEKAAAGACDRTTSGPCDHEGVATYTPTKPCCDEVRHPGISHLLFYLVWLLDSAHRATMPCPQSLQALLHCTSRRGIASAHLQNSCCKFHFKTTQRGYIVQAQPLCLHRAEATIVEKNCGLRRE